MKASQRQGGLPYGRRLPGRRWQLRTPLRLGAAAAASVLLAAGVLEGLRAAFLAPSWRGASRSVGSAACSHAVGGRQVGSRPSTSGRLSLQAEAATAGANTKLWSLVVRCTDHYVWRDENVFVGIVADAGEWEIKPDNIKAAFKEAREVGSAAVLVAPLYVVKDYLKELRNYGLVAEAVEALPEAAAAAADGDSWRKRDWKELPPELKETASVSRAEAEAAAAGGSMRIWVLNSDHAALDGSRTAEMKFRAYVELAADAAKRFAPEEAILNACYARIRGKSGRAVVLESLAPDAAERALKQLQSAGFIAEVEAEPRKDEV